MLISALILAQTVSGWMPLTLDDLDPAGPDYDFRTGDRGDYLSARADFDGDGDKDRAALAKNEAGETALVVWLDDEAQVLTSLRASDVARMGVSLQPPETLQAACAKGYGGGCGPDDPETIKLDHTAIELFTFKSAASVYYWDGAGFQRVWISD